MHSRACQMSSGKPALTKDSRNVYQAGEEKRMWIKIQCARGRTAKQCHQGLREAGVAAAIPFRTVARWVAAFRDGREHVKHMPQSGHPSVNNENVSRVGSERNNLSIRARYWTRAESVTVPLKTLNRLPNALFAPLIDLAMPMVQLPRHWEHVVHNDGD